MKIKPGAKIDKIEPQLLLGLVIADQIYYRFGADMVITEISGSKHMAGSLHYKGRAADLRTKNLDPLMLIDVVEEIRVALDKDYDVVLEPDHIHLEYDPK